MNELALFDFNDPGRKKQMSSVNFVLTDFLALGSDERVFKRGYDMDCIDLDASISCELGFVEATHCLTQIFETTVLLFFNASKVHMELMPFVIHKDDAMILNDHVHSNIRIGAGLLRNRGNVLLTIPCHDIQLLEDRIIALKAKSKKIWYLTDSIYAFLSEEINFNGILYLLEKYEQFYVYIDDSKGISWTGKNGSGYVFKHLHNNPKVMISASLNKGFGCEGGIMICQNIDLMNQFESRKKELSFEFNRKHDVLSSIIKSAHIHLSDEIYVKQKELAEKIEFFYSLAKGFGLPIVSQSNTPVVFFLLRKPELSQEICFKIRERGFYLNVVDFPMVSANDSGIMANITLHQSKHEIREMLSVFKEIYEKVIRKQKLTGSQLFRGIEM